MKNTKLAWRNLWRNKRRTLITVASVFFAVFFALLMRSLQLGSYDHMFRNIIESYTGYAQIQHEDFRENSTVDNVFEYTPDVEKVLFSHNNVTSAVPRFESFALASTGSITKGVLVVGIDPEKEKLLSGADERLVSYRFSQAIVDSLKQIDLPEEVKSSLDLVRDNAYASEALLQVELGISDKDTAKIMPLIKKISAFRNGYITGGRHQALIGDRLARFLNMNVGDTLVLVGQGYHGTTAAGKFEIAGIVKFPTPDLDNKIVYLPVDVCQEFYNAPSMLTSLALIVKSNKDKDLDRMVESIKSELPAPLKILGWREMNELLINQMDADSKSGMIMIGILYMIIAFGIFGTVLMMTAERKREFSVLIAIGMQKTKLAAMVALEMLLIGILGILSGICIALPAILIGKNNPIRFTGEMAKMYEDYGMEPVMPFMSVDFYFLWQTLVVAIIVCIAIIYPVRKIFRMKPVGGNT